MTKRKDRNHGQEAKEETPMLSDKPMHDADPDVINSYGVRVFEFSDGTWAVVSERDGQTDVVTERRPRRLFLRDFNRARSKQDDLVFKGAVRSVR